MDASNVSAGQLRIGNVPYLSRLVEIAGRQFDLDERHERLPLGLVANNPAQSLLGYLPVQVEIHRVMSGASGQRYLVLDRGRDRL